MWIKTHSSIKMISLPPILYALSHSRWFYAFKYAGLLPSDLSKYVVKKAEPRPTPAPPPPPKKLHPIVLMMSPTGTAPDGRKIPFICDNM